MRTRNTSAHPRALVLAIVFLGLVGWVQPADAGVGATAQRSADDPREQREDVKAEAAENAAELDALQADQAEVAQALADLQANVQTQEALLVDARRAADQALVEAEQARTAQAAAEARLAELTAQLKLLAIEAYIDPTSQGDPGFTILGSSSANEAVLKSALVQLRAGSNVDLIDEVEAARQDLATQRAAADAALDRAIQAEAEAEGRVSQVTAARDQQQQFAAEVEARINHTLAEAAGLAELDKELSDQIAAEEAALAAQAAAAQGSGSSGGGGSGGGSGGSVPGNADVPLTNVGGIIVNTAIADELGALLAAAEADGFNLGGGGYRSTAAQIALRKAHCGTSYYAIYQMPASQCSPPTAPPGTSMHEQGLAIDFTWNGSVITSQSSPAFQWLDAHANAYGFYNLPSEPWHWSVNGN